MLVSDSKMKIFSKGALAAIFWGGFRPVLIRPMFMDPISFSDLN